MTDRRGILGLGLLDRPRFLEREATAALVPLQMPVIHRGGTPKEMLLEQTLEVVHALRDVRNAMAKAAPNGRDFFLAGPDALRVAETAHRQRADLVRQLEEDYEALAVKISDVE